MSCDISDTREVLIFWAHEISLTFSTWTETHVISRLKSLLRFINNNKWPILRSYACGPGVWIPFLSTSALTGWVLYTHTHDTKRLMMTSDATRPNRGFDNAEARGYRGFVDPADLTRPERGRLWRFVVGWQPSIWETWLQSLLFFLNMKTKGKRMKICEHFTGPCRVCFL